MEAAPSQWFLCEAGTAVSLSPEHLERWIFSSLDREVVPHVLLPGLGQEKPSLDYPGPSLAAQPAEQLKGKAKHRDGPGRRWEGSKTRSHHPALGPALPATSRSPAGKGLWPALPRP